MITSFKIFITVSFIFFKILSSNKIFLHLNLYTLETTLLIDLHLLLFPFSLLLLRKIVPLGDELTYSSTLSAFSVRIKINLFPFFSNQLHLILMAMFLSYFIATRFGILSYFVN